MTENTVETTEATVEQPGQPETAQPEEKGPDLNISDLAALKNIVEVASQRGAFKANELEAVGKTFNKLNAFLEAVSNNKEE